MWQRCLGFSLALLLGACAAPKRVPSEQLQWQGRLSMTVQSEPPTASSASFSLLGNAREGELDLYSPLGTTVASLHWTPQAAYLHQGAQANEFGSLNELTEKTTGADLPVQALFAWLHGTPTPVTGWRSDLSQLEQGKLIATRQWPEPVVILRIQLDTAP